jgi:RNA polymerase sigma-B factor
VAAIVCVTAPLLPGLAMRTDTSRFDGAACTVLAAEAVSAGAVLPAAAAAAAEIVWVTLPSSPGLPMRTDTFTFEGALWLTAAAASTVAGAAGSVGAAGAGAAGVGTATAGAAGAAGVAAGAGAVSARAGTAKPSASAERPSAAAPIRVASREIRAPPSGPKIRSDDPEIPTAHSVYATSKKWVDLFAEKREDRCMVATLDPVEDLVDRHLPLVRSLARRFAGCGEPLDDLVQVGAVGLVAAARRFDPGRGVPFAAYAVPTVRGELRRYVRDRASTIRVPRREQECAATLRRAAQDAAQRLGHEASLAETAAAAGIPLDEARRALAGPATVPLSALDRRTASGDEDEFEACEDREFVRELYASLRPLERRLLRLRFDDGLSQAQIAERVGISQSQASRRLAAALEELRRSAAAGSHPDSHWAA